MIVLDTSALLFWTLDPIQLSRKAMLEIEQAEKVVISSISVWEIALKIKRKKLTIPLTIKDYVERLERLETLEIFPVDTQIWLENVDLPWEHRDPADRTIVALATRFDCSLVSSDQAIAKFYSKTTW